MHAKPNYETLRDETKFRWYVSSTYSALLEVTGIPTREFYLNPAAGIELYRKGRSMLREMFGPDVATANISTPAVSYGHINGLGAKLIFPDDGEVNHGHLCETLPEAVEILKKPVDFAAAGMAPFYLDYRRELRQAFADEDVGFWYVAEGPITTAYTIRRDEFFYDPYDNPDLTKEFLRLLVDSIIEFTRFHRSVMGEPEISPTGAGMCDDIASMLGPAMWPEFVLPYWRQYYDGLTTGKRTAHVEDLKSEQVPFLEEIDLFDYDPSISPKINPAIISRECRVPFGWRLGNFHYPPLTADEVADFVFQAAADGASYVFTIVADGMCNEPTVEKVHSFIRAGRQVEKMLSEGATREQVGQCVSLAGRKKFWDHWPE